MISAYETLRQIGPLDPQPFPYAPQNTTNTNRKESFIINIVEDTHLRDLRFIHKPDGTRFQFSPNL